jgi:lipoate-protein ligase A
MRFLDLSLPEAAANLALDEALLLEAEAGRGGEVLRVWEQARPAVVLGAGRRLAEDVVESACVTDGVPVQRRSSGGGTVLLGRGCLLFTLVLSYERSVELNQVRSSYRYILGRVAAALQQAAPGAAAAGTSDLAVGGRKFSGNAQQRKRDFLLHHGTLLYDFDLGTVGKYLRVPADQPEYRAKRGHGEFLVNLCAARAELVGWLREAWSAEENAIGWPEEPTLTLVAERYGQETWARRR